MNTEDHNSTSPSDRDVQKSEPSEIISDSGGFEITLSDDKYECWVKMSKTGEGVMPEKAELLKALEEKKIAVDCINKEELNRIFNEHVFEVEVLIAEGKFKRDGVDSTVKYFFKTDVKEQLKEDDKGKVDFKEIDLIQRVKQGEVVAELAPPKKGADGITVTGEIIKAKDGKPANLPAGLNTEISKDNPNRLIALIDGSVSLKRNKVNVDPVVVIEGDVDFSTGNIDFNGAVIIKGDVKAGFAVKSEGDVTINGVVEDAVIETKGNAIFKGGFVGRGTGKLKAEGDILLPFAENQNIYSGKSVVVTDALLHCTVEADEKVTVSGNKGVIGGSVFTHESIEVQSAGSQTYIKTVLSVGVKREIQEKMDQYKVDLQNNKTNLRKIDNIVQVYDKIRLIKHTLPPKKQELYDKLLDVKKKLLEEEKKLAKTKEELDVVFKHLENAVIQVKQQVFPGVTIEFGEMKKTIREEITGASFKIKDGAIIILKKTQEKG